MIYGGNMITSMGLLYILFIGKKSNDRIDYLYGYIKTMVIWTILMYSSLEILSVGNRVEYYGSNVPLFRRNGYRQSGVIIP